MLIVSLVASACLLVAINWVAFRSRAGFLTAWEGFGGICSKDCMITRSRCLLRATGLCAVKSDRKIWPRMAGLRETYGRHSFPAKKSPANPRDSPRHEFVTIAGRKLQGTNCLTEKIRSCAHTSLLGLPTCNLQLKLMV